MQIRDFVTNELAQIMTSLEQEGKLPEFIILGGDTNTVFSSQDKIGGSQNYKKAAINAFRHMTDKFDLHDSFRLKHPDVKKFSWE